MLRTREYRLRSNELKDIIDSNDFGNLLPIQKLKVIFCY